MVKDLKNLPIREAIIVSQGEKIKKLTEALEKIVSEIGKTQVKLIDTASPLQMALYTVYHTAKEALKES